MNLGRTMTGLYRFKGLVQNHQRSAKQSMNCLGGSSNISTPNLHLRKTIYMLGTFDFACDLGKEYIQISCWMVMDWA